MKVLVQYDERIFSKFLTILFFIILTATWKWKYFKIFDKKLNLKLNYWSHTEEHQGENNNTAFKV